MRSPCEAECLLCATNSYVDIPIGKSRIIMRRIRLRLMAPRILEKRDSAGVIQPLPCFVQFVDLLRHLICGEVEILLQGGDQLVTHFYQARELTAEIFPLHGKACPTNVELQIEVVAFFHRLQLKCS